MISSVEHAAGATVAMAAARSPAKVLAPAPAIDRSPIIIGQNLSLSYMASAYRSALTGFRQNFVDLLAELFEHDPHATAIFSKRVLAVAGARYEIVPADLPDGDPDRARADEIADFARTQWEALPMRAQTLAQLMWGIAYGLSGGENHWSRRAECWNLDRISFVHSRRLSMPDPTSWDVHIWDLGAVTSPGVFGPTQGTFGLRCSDYPGKFIVHAPQLRAEYATRDGIGRVLGTYMLLKRMVVRNAAQDAERFTKPWVVAYYRTLDDKGEPRTAGDDDVAAGTAAVNSLGAGSLSSATLPDSIKIELLKASTDLPIGEFLEYLDAAISKAVQGQTFTTQTGKYGSRSTADVGRKEALAISRYDAACLADTLERDVIQWIVRLNYQDADRLMPRLRIVVDDAPDPNAYGELIQRCAQVGYPIDADATAQIMGVPLLPNPGGEPRGLKAPQAPEGGEEDAEDEGQEPEKGDAPDDPRGTDGAPPDDDPDQAAA